MNQRWRNCTATLVCVAVLVAACTSNSSSGPTNQSATETVQAFTMQDQIGWLIGALDAGEFDPAEARQRFHPEFLAEVTVAGLNAPLLRFAADGRAPWELVEDHREGWFAEITVESMTGTRLAIAVALGPNEPHLIEGLTIRPASVDVPEGYTAEQLDADMAALAQQSAVGVYDVTAGDCEPIHEHNGDQPMAVGSIFKLWVLAELANQIDEGTAAWTEPLDVRAELRSNPAGRIFYLDTGATPTLREYAEAMISISDNTATDHLIDRLGRTAIEAGMDRAGVARPELNEPLLATRELFWLKYLATAPNPTDWYLANTDQRRSILADLTGQTVPWVLDPTLVTAPNAEGLPQDQPRNLDIEYFASPQDLCRTFQHLDALTSTPGLEPVADILSINPGTELDPQTWTDIRFKGGNEPGVVALTWWLRRADGRTFIVAGMLNDPDVAFDQLAATALLTNAIALI